LEESRQFLCGGLSNRSEPVQVSRKIFDGTVNNLKGYRMTSKKFRGTVGIVGLGIMGGAFARHLRAARFNVVGYDLAAARRKALRKVGGVAVASAAEVGAGTRILITSLPSLAAFEAALFGKNGVAAGARQGTIVIEASTLPLNVKEDARKRLAKTGVILLDCPISGTGAQAAAKDIVIYASGDRRACARCKAVFAGFARNAYYCGEFGVGSKLKFIANLLVTIHNLSTAEAFVLAEEAGVDTELMYRVIKDGAGTSRMFEVRGPMMVKQNYLPATMKIDVYQKDIAIIKAFAAKLRCPTPLFSLSKRYYDLAYAGGYEKHDTAAVHAVLQKIARAKRKRAFSD
jgi:3-hydroxyisobutyrate dehydrogenase-like beta-hydroxyacid dehydrogenase